MGFLQENSALEKLNIKHCGYQLHQLVARCRPDVLGGRANCTARLFLDLRRHIASHRLVPCSPQRLLFKGCYLLEKEDCLLWVN